MTVDWDHVKKLVTRAHELHAEPLTARELDVLTRALEHDERRYRALIRATQDLRLHGNAS